MDQSVYISIAKDGAWHVGTEEKLRRRVADEAFKELRHKLWMVACHATGGGIPEIEGIDRSINHICVQITQSRNAIYQAGKDAALATQPATSQDVEAAVQSIVAASGGKCWEDPGAVEALRIAFKAGRESAPHSQKGGQ